MIEDDMAVQPFEDALMSSVPSTPPRTGNPRNEDTDSQHNVQYLRATIASRRQELEPTFAPSPH